jgi:hypothetical protein
VCRREVVGTRLEYSIMQLVSVSSRLIKYQSLSTLLTVRLSSITHLSCDVIAFKQEPSQKSVQASSTRSADPWLNNWCDPMKIQYTNKTTWSDIINIIINDFCEIEISICDDRNTKNTIPVWDSLTMRHAIDGTGRSLHTARYDEDCRGQSATGVYRKWKYWIYFSFFSFLIFFHLVCAT